MLKGNNELRLNEATLMAAVEEYLNNRIASTVNDIRVVGVSEATTPPTPRTFRVLTSEKK